MEINWKTERRRAVRILGRIVGFLVLVMVIAGLVPIPRDATVLPVVQSARDAVRTSIASDNGG